jgi:hypothetical protein
MNRLLVWWLPVEVRARKRALWAALVVGGLLGLVVWLVVKHRVDWPTAAAVFASKGRSVRVELTALEWIWKALVVNAVLLLGLLLSVRWWSMPQVAVAKAEPQRVRTHHSTGVWMIVLLVLGLAVGLRGPRMTMSLYNDEAHNYARLWSGEWQMKEGALRLDKPRWGETLFWNVSGNNSPIFSLAARGCLDLAEKVGWRVNGEVTEWAVRLPALLAGLTTLFVMGGLARRRWGIRGMVVVMLVLAVHPWHVRYSTEARGYSFMLLGIALMLWFADRALASGRWRDWVGYGAGVFLCAASFLGSIYFLVCFSVGLLWHQARAGKHSGDWSRLARPMVASLGAAMVGLVLLWPMIPPLLRVLEEHDSIRGEMGLRWWKDVAGYLIAGTRWVDEAVENPANLALSRWVQGGWWAALVLWLMLMVGGLRLLWKEGGVVRVMAWAVPASLVLAWGLMSRKGNFLNYWYVLHGVLWVTLVIGAAGVKVVELRRTLGPVILLAGLLIPARVAFALRLLPKQHERTPVIEALGAVYPGIGKIEPRPLLGAFWCNSNLYHPEVVWLRDEKMLMQLIKQAHEEARPLFVCFSHRGAAVEHDPALVRAVENEAVFQKVATYFGLEESQYTAQLFMLKTQK